jgi:cytochrome b
MAVKDPHPGTSIQVRVWDMPTRIFHWLIVVLVAFSWLTIEIDEFAWHQLSGYTILALVLFRIYWGFAGSSSARFGSFLRGPKAFWSYFRRILDRPGAITAGHNPMGGWSVLVMLLLLLLQVGLGLFSTDPDAINSGPLDYLVSFKTGRRIEGLHEAVFNILLFVIGLHVAAILFYFLYKRENLLGAMFSGFKKIPTGSSAPEPRFAAVWVAIPGLLAAAGFAVWVAFGAHL